MNKMTLSVIGLIGGILVVVGVFLPWVSASVFGITVNASGWDIRASGSYIYVILIGGIIALLGGILALAAVKIEKLGYLVLLGGILAILGWIWAATDVGDWSAVTYGFYTCLVGAILALIGGMSVRRKK
jgi:hypothetical protein